MDDVVAHGATIPSAPWPSRVQPRCRRPSARSASSSPSRSASTASTSGRCLPLGLALGRARRRRSANVSRTVADRLIALTVVRRRSSAPRTSARACSCSSGGRRRPARVAGSSAGSSSSRSRFSCSASSSRGSPGSRRSGSSCRSLVVERLGVRAALRAGWQLARADFVHALGSLVTLAIVVFAHAGACSPSSCAVRRCRRQTAAVILADVVLSPLLFLGAALLYVDQAARVEVE